MWLFGRIRGLPEPSHLDFAILWIFAHSQGFHLFLWSDYEFAWASVLFNWIFWTFRSDKVSGKAKIRKGRKKFIGNGKDWYSSSISTIREEHSPKSIVAFKLVIILARWNLVRRRNKFYSMSGSCIRFTAVHDVAEIDRGSHGPGEHMVCSMQSADLCNRFLSRRNRPPKCMFRDRWCVSNAAAVDK